MQSRDYRHVRFRQVVEEIDPMHMYDVDAVIAKRAADGVACLLLCLMADSGRQRPIMYTYRQQRAGDARGLGGDDQRVVACGRESFIDSADDLLGSAHAVGS